jgi:molybdopterin synthase catalytic subunit
MRVKVLFFGVLKDVVGKPEDLLDLAEGATVGGVFEEYARRFPPLREMAASIVPARNQEFSPVSTPVEDGDEVAFLPPVSGGTGEYAHEIAENGHFFALTRQPVRTRKAIDRLLRGEDGAVVTFEGVVRNNTNGRRTRYLDYECYEPMAVKVMAAIGREIAEHFEIDRIAMIHRL